MQRIEEASRLRAAAATISAEAEARSGAEVQLRRARARLRAEARQAAVIGTTLAHRLCTRLTSARAGREGASSAIGASSDVAVRLVDEYAKRASACAARLQALADDARAEAESEPEPQAAAASATAELTAVAAAVVDGWCCWVDVLDREASTRELETSSRPAAGSESEQRLTLQLAEERARSDGLRARVRRLEQQLLDAAPAGGGASPPRAAAADPPGGAGRVSELEARCESMAASLARGDALSAEQAASVHEMRAERDAIRAERDAVLVREAEGYTRALQLQERLAEAEARVRAAGGEAQVRADGDAAGRRELADAQAELSRSRSGEETLRRQLGEARKNMQRIARRSSELEVKLKAARTPSQSAEAAPTLATSSEADAARAAARSCRLERRVAEHARRERELDAELANARDELEKLRAEASAARSRRGSRGSAPPRGASAAPLSARAAEEAAQRAQAEARQAETGRQQAEAEAEAMRAQVEALRGDVNAAEEKLRDATQEREWDAEMHKMALDAAQQDAEAERQKGARLLRLVEIIKVRPTACERMPPGLATRVLLATASSRAGEPRPRER